MRLLTMNERVRAAKTKVILIAAIMLYLLLRHWITGAPLLPVLRTRASQSTIAELVSPNCAWC